MPYYIIYVYVFVSVYTIAGDEQMVGSEERWQDQMEPRLQFQEWWSLRHLPKADVTEAVNFKKKEVHQHLQTLHKQGRILLSGDLVFCTTD